MFEWLGKNLLMDQFSTIKVRGAGEGTVTQNICNSFFTLYLPLTLPQYELFLVSEWNDLRFGDQVSGPCFLYATNLPAFNFGRNQSFVYQAWFADPQEEGAGKTRLQNSRRKTKRGPETRKTRPQDTLRWVQNLTKVKILRPLANLGFWRTQICKVTCALKHSKGNILPKRHFCPLVLSARISQI